METFDTRKDVHNSRKQSRQDLFQAFRNIPDSPEGVDHAAADMVLIFW